MNEIVKELLDALHDCVRVMSAELKGLLVSQPELEKARAAIGKAEEAILAATQPSANVVLEQAPANSLPTWGECRPAFPTTTEHGFNCGEPGMTLRDYFAAKAMPSCYAEYCEHANVQGYEEGWKTGVALDSYEMADAMLRARDRGVEQSESDRRVAAPQPADDGWIPWAGGERPVDTIVEVKLRNGGIIMNFACIYDWRHINDPVDIVAYRVVKP